MLLLNTTITLLYCIVVYFILFFFLLHLHIIIITYISLNCPALLDYFILHILCIITIIISIFCTYYFILFFAHFYHFSIFITLSLVWHNPSPHDYFSVLWQLLEFPLVGQIKDLLSYITLVHGKLPTQTIARLLLTTPLLITSQRFCAVLFRIYNCSVKSSIL